LSTETDRLGTFKWFPKDLPSNQMHLMATVVIEPPC
jgi:hypothetical protein